MLPLLFGYFWPLLGETQTHTSMHAGACALVCTGACIVVRETKLPCGVYPAAACCRLAREAGV